MSLDTPVPGCARADIQCTVAGREVESSLWYRSVTGDTSDDNVLVLANRVAVIAGITKGVFSADYTYRQVSARSYNTGPGTPQVSTSLAGSGLQPTNSLSAGIALRLLLTTLPMPTSHPFCVYLAGVPEGEVEGNTISITWAEQVALAFDNFRFNIPFFNWELVCVSRILNGAPRVVPIVYSVTGFQVADYLVHGRRMRLNGR